jgi:hypothetical protein
MLEDLEALRKNANDTTEDPASNFDLKSWVEALGKHLKEGNEMLASCPVETLLGKGVFVARAKKRVKKIIRKLNHALSLFVTILMSLQIDIQRLRNEVKDDASVRPDGSNESSCTTTAERKSALKEMVDLP